MDIKKNKRKKSLKKTLKIIKEIKSNTPKIIFKVKNLVVTLRNKSQLNRWLELYPDGKYTRKYLPVLSDIPDKFLFNPWEAPKDVLESAGIKLGENYPLPIVEIGSSRQKALEAFATTKTLIA